MTTAIIKAAGGRDYTSLVAWEAALPATLTEDETAQIIGDITLPTSGLTINVNANGHNITIEPFPGDGSDVNQDYTAIFNPATTALRAPAITGCARIITGGSFVANNTCLNFSSQNVTMSRIVVDVDSTISGNGGAEVFDINETGFIGDRLLVRYGASDTGSAVGFSYFVRHNGTGSAGATSTFRNCYFYFVKLGVKFRVFRCRTHAGNVLNFDSCNMVVASDLTWPSGDTNALFQVQDSGTINVNNCGIFGFPTINMSTSVGAVTGDYNHSNVASSILPGGAGVANVGGITFGRFAPFKDANSASFDAYPIDASALQNSGGTVLVEDMLGTARPQGAQDDAGALELPEAPAVPSGVGDQTAPAATQAASGANGDDLSGAGDQTAPAPSQDATAVERFDGTGDQTAPGATQAASGVHGDLVSAVGDQTAPAPSQDATAAESFDGAGDQSAPRPSQGSIGISGGSIVFMPPPFVAIAVLVQPTIVGGGPWATADQTAPRPSQAGIGTAEQLSIGAGDQSAPRPSQAATAAERFEAAGDQSAPRPSQAANASHGDTIAGNGDQSAPRPSQAAQSEIRIEGAGDQSAPRPSQAAQSEIRIEAVGNQAAPRPSQSGLGTPEFSGIGDQAVRGMSQEGIGGLYFESAGDQSAPRPSQGPAFVPIAAAPVKLFEVHPSEWLFEA